MHDAVVVGGGLAGAAVAYHLVSSGARTALVDRRDPGRATDAGAGILSPETARHEHPGWWPLVRACGDHYPELVSSLGADTGYATCGLLAVALADWDLDAFEDLRSAALARAEERGTTSLADIPPDEARARFPALGNVTRALVNPTAARVDGRQLTAALLDAATARGLQRVDAGADRIAVDAGRAVAVEAGATTLPCGAVVVAGGAWTPQLADQLDAALPVQPERGQIVHLRTAAATEEWPIVMPVLGCYLVPWPAGRVAVGATREAGSGFDARPTVAGLRLVLNEVARVAPGLVDAAFVEVRVGLRPVSADDLPVVGPLPHLPNVHLATGYGANGLLLSPWCGREVAAVVGGAPLNPVLEPFLPARFALAG